MLLFLNGLGLLASQFLDAVIDLVLLLVVAELSAVVGEHGLV